MMQNKSRIIALYIILLFIGVAVAPSINQSVVKASQEDDLVEVTTQACGIQGYKDTTVKLTREQYQNLEQYLVEFRERLNQTTTREEAVPLFKEAVVELDTYGLLPRGMSVEQAQRLVMNPFIKQRMKKNLLNNINKNYFCLITGHMNNTLCVHRTNFWIYRLANFVDKIYYFLMKISPNRFPLLQAFIDIVYLVIFISLLTVASAFPILLVNKNPIALFNIFGVGYFNWHSNNTIYAGGWANSFGLLGKKAWNGSLVGNLHDQWVVWDPYLWVMKPGIIGFNGLKIGLDDDYCEKFFLGSALAVGFDEQK